MTEKLKNDLLTGPAAMTDNPTGAAMPGVTEPPVAETAEHQSADNTAPGWSDPVRRAYKYSYSALYLNVDIYL